METTKDTDTNSKFELLLPSGEDYTAVPCTQETLESLSTTAPVLSNTFNSISVAMNFLDNQGFYATFRVEPELDYKVVVEELRREGVKEGKELSPAESNALIAGMAAIFGEQSISIVAPDCKAELFIVEPKDTGKDNWVGVDLLVDKSDDKNADVSWSTMLFDLDDKYSIIGSYSPMEKSVVTVEGKPVDVGKPIMSILKGRSDKILEDLKKKQ